MVVTLTPGQLAGQLEDRRQPTTTLEGWRRFVDAEEATFDLLPDADRDALEETARIRYDEARIAYHAEMIVVTTSTVRQILHQGRLLTLLNQRGLFTGTRGRQIAGRAALVRTGAFPYQQEWKGLVATMEHTLRLHRHQPGTLVGLDRYLHQRTGGMIGSLSHLIRAAAISAILDGSEQLTQELLDAIKLDHAAESSTRRASSHH